MEAKHTATFELPQHPHPAAQNDTQRVIEINGEKAIVVVHAQNSSGFDAERIAKEIVLTRNAHDCLVTALQDLLASSPGIAKATEEELNSAVADQDAKEIVRIQAAAILQARAALAAAGASQ